MKAVMNLVLDPDGTIKAMSVNPDKKTDTSKLVLAILKAWSSGVWVYNEDVNTIMFAPAVKDEEAKK